MFVRQIVTASFIFLLSDRLVPGVYEANNVSDPFFLSDITLLVLYILKKKKNLGGDFFLSCVKMGSPDLGTAQQPQEQRYPFLSVCAVFSCVQTMVCLPVFGIFNVRTLLC